MQNYLEPVADGLLMRESGAWVTEKLDYLQRYIEIFETSMRGAWSRRNFIDLFAGPGKCYDRRSGAVYLGSPLIALTTRYPFTGYFFLDSDHENIKALETRCAASSLKNVIHCMANDANEAAGEIVRQIKDADRKQKSNSLNLAFLDPEGLELHWNTVATLASVSKMDLIIHYSVQGLNRTLENASKVEEHKLDLYFGDRKWRTIYQKIGDVSVVERELLLHYKKKLEALGYVEIMQDEHTGNEPPIRNTKGGLLYRLLFASKHSLGDKFWKEVIRRDVHGQRRFPGF